MQEIKIPIDYSALIKAQEEVARLTAELQRMMESGDGSVGEMQRLQDELMEARKSVAENADELERWANITAGDLSEAIEKAEFAVNQLNDTVEANNEIIAGLQENYDSAKDGLEELTAQVAEFDEIKLELSQWEQLKDQMDGDSEAVSEAEAKIKELKDRLAELEPKMAGVNDKIKAKTDKMAEAQKAMDKEKASLAENTRAQTQMQMTLDQTKRRYEMMTASVIQKNEEMKKSFQSFQNTATTIFTKVGLGAGLVGLVETAKQVRAENQKIETDLGTLLGSKGASSIMKDLKQLALVTPLAMSDMANAEKTMVSFGLDAKKSVEYIKAISDISGGEGAKFSSLALAFSQASAAGKLMGQDLIELCRAA